MVYVATILSAAAAGIAQGITGFGSGLVIMSVLPFFLGVTDAAAVCGLVMLLLNLVATWHFRAKVSLKRIALPTLCFFLGSSVSILNVKNIPVKQLQVCFGIFLIVLALYFIFYKKGGTIRDNAFTMVLCCTGAGLCDGLFSIGGPPLAMYFLAHSDGDTEQYLTDQQSCYLIADIFTASMRIYEGILTPRLAVTGMTGLIGVLIGMGLAFRLIGKIDDKTLRKAIYAMMGISGAVTVIKALM